MSGNMSGNISAPRNAPRLLPGLALLAVMSLLGGCYQHVVRASGPGARKVQVYEPNLPEENRRIPVVDDVEDAVFGTPTKRSRP